MSECNICFCDIENMIFRCSNIDCACKVCQDCLERYVLYLDKGLPKCIVKECTGEFLYTEISRCGNKKVLDKYILLCFNFLKNDNFDDIMKETNHKIMLENIRKEKHDFILKEFPISVSFVITKALKAKLNKIDKKNREHVKESVVKLVKKCPNIFCYSGVLDVNFACISCTQKYCKKCEGLIEGDVEHECKKEDIETLNLIQTLVKCPTCKLPVVKSYGCNNITCSNCKTNFDYITGEKTIAGNHSDDSIKLKTYDKPSLMLERGSYDKYTLSIIQEIESKEPEPYSFTNIYNKLKKYIELEKTSSRVLLENLKLKICLHYETYMLTQYKKRKFFKCMVLIQKESEKDLLTNEFLLKINKVLV